MSEENSNKEFKEVLAGKFKEKEPEKENFDINVPSKEELEKKFEQELKDRSIMDLENMKTVYEKNIVLRRQKLEELIQVSLTKNNGTLLNMKTGKSVPLTEGLQQQLRAQNEKNIYDEYGKKLEKVNEVLEVKVKQNIDDLNKEIRSINFDLNKMNNGNVIKQYDQMKAKFLADKLRIKQTQVKILENLNKNNYQYYVREDKKTKKKKVYIAAEKAYEKQQYFVSPLRYQKGKEYDIPELKSWKTTDKFNGDKYNVVLRSGFMYMNLGKGASRYKYETDRAKVTTMIYSEISNNAIDGEPIFTRSDAEKILTGLNIKAIDPNIVYGIIKYEKEHINYKNLDAHDEYTKLRTRISKDIGNYYVQVKDRKQNEDFKILYDLRASSNLVGEKYKPLKEQAFYSKIFATIKTNLLDRVAWLFKPEDKEASRMETKNDSNQKVETQGVKYRKDYINNQFIPPKPSPEEEIQIKEAEERKQFEKDKVDIMVEAYKARREKLEDDEGISFDSRI